MKSLRVSVCDSDGVASVDFVADGVSPVLLAVGSSVLVSVSVLDGVGALERVGVPGVTVLESLPLGVAVLIFEVESVAVGVGAGETVSETVGLVSEGVWVPVGAGETVMVAVKVLVAIGVSVMDSDRDRVRPVLRPKTRQYDLAAGGAPATVAREIWPVKEGPVLSQIQT